MAEKKKDPAKVLLKRVRLSYPALWKAKSYGKGEGEPKFQANFLMEKDDRLGQKNIAKMEDAIDFVKSEKWPKGAPKLAAAKICLRDSEDMEEMSDGYDGCMYVSSSSSKKPRVLDADGLDVKEGEDGAPYAGCYVDAIVRVWAQDNEYGKRINCSLEGVKFREDGDAFGAAPIDPDDFDEDDDDDRPSRSKSRGRSRDDDEDERPKRRSSDDDEDERPKRRSRDEDEDDRPKRRSRDDDEDERPKRRSRDDDEDEKPRRRSRDDDEDERPKRRSREEDDEPPPRRRRSRDDDVA